MALKSATTKEITTGRVKRLTVKSAKAAVVKMSDQQLSKLKAEDKRYESAFKNSKVLIKGAVMGRPQKEIKREVVAIRVPSDALVKIKALGKGWSTRAGDALAKMVSEGLL